MIEKLTKEQESKLHILKCKCHAVCENGFVYTRFLSYRLNKSGKKEVILKDSWKKLKLTKGSRGYYQVHLHKTNFRVNRLVAKAFLKKKKDLNEVRHLNGIKTDNRAINLEWSNSKTNNSDKLRHGTSINGEKSVNSKLKEKDVLKIKSLLKNNSIKNVAKQFNVSPTLILLINRGKAWKHLEF